MTKTVRKNYVPKILKEIGWDQDKFLREAYYHERIARNTALKVFKGETDIELDTVEKVCVLLKRPLSQVFEIVVN